MWLSFSLCGPANKLELTKSSFPVFNTPFISGDSTWSVIFRLRWDIPVHHFLCLPSHSLTIVPTASRTFHPLKGLDCSSMPTITEVLRLEDPFEEQPTSRPVYEWRVSRRDRQEDGQGIHMFTRAHLITKTFLPQQFGRSSATITSPPSKW